MTDDLTFPDGWGACASPDGFLQELRRELVKGHPLYGKDLAAVAVRRDRDDALFRSPAGEMFVVHLTWIQKPERPPWPIVIWSSTRHDFDEFGSWSRGHYDDGPD